MPLVFFCFFLFSFFRFSQWERVKRDEASAYLTNMTPRDGVSYILRHNGVIDAILSRKKPSLGHARKSRIKTTRDIDWSEIFNYRLTGWSYSPKSEKEKKKKK